MSNCLSLFFGNRTGFLRQRRRKRQKCRCIAFAKSQTRPHTGGFAAWAPIFRAGAPLDAGACGDAFVQPPGMVGRHDRRGIEKTVQGGAAGTAALSDPAGRAAAGCCLNDRIAGLRDGRGMFMPGEADASPGVVSYGGFVILPWSAASSARLWRRRVRHRRRSMARIDEYTRQEYR